MQTMSWFDTSGIANIAKTALKEAQRTIDKALDIKEEDSVLAPANTPIDTNSDDFFGTWGLSQPASETKDQLDDGPKSPSKVAKNASLWGSFTGSFFEYSRDALHSRHPRDSVDSLDDSIDLATEQFSGSKLVVHDDSDVGFSRLSSYEEESTEEKDNNSTIQEDPLETPEANDRNLLLKQQDKPDGNNRLSTISTDSERKSSESVEVLSGDCTSSPDSEAISNSSSALGSKPTSESVEVLPNSLTSPSSIEVIESESSFSRRQSQYTDEFVSPLLSPDEQSSVSEKMTPESVEVIPEDENSIAEDTISYNSLSESTAATVLDGFNSLLKTKPIAITEAMVESVSSEQSLSPDKMASISELPITRAPSRSGLHLPLTLIDTQPQSSKEDLTVLTKTSNVIDIPLEGDRSFTSETEDGSQSDKTMIASDNIMDSSSDTASTNDSNSNSFYVKNLLADAMTERRSDGDQKSEHYMDLCQSMIDSSQKSGSSEQLETISIVQLDMPPRENSPVSSESRSDLVKIGSDHTSGHTSGDELETTTSSDIEIISSPNGDSSSTHSRHSPAKTVCSKAKGDANVDNLLGRMTFKNIKGHNRELSEASSISDDTEIERLIKRLSETTEILESRETKLIEVSRKNAELQEANADLRKQLDVFINKQLESADLSQVTEEYTQRLSALERKFQQAIRDKDSLRKQLEQCKLENATRMSKSELDSVLEEKDETIKELRQEGEKLSKQHLQHSNIIKKLRAKEKEHETSIKHLKDSVEDLTSEADRLKRSLTAKEEVERTQIEAVHQLTARNKKLEYEVNQLQGNFDDVTQKYETSKKSLDAAKKELIDKHRASNELIHREQMLQSLENEKKMTESQNEEIITQLDNLRGKLRDADQDYVKKEQALRLENAELMRRLEDAERRNEELTQSVLEVSKPLVRQLENLQATHNMKLTSFEKIERTLIMKQNELQSKLNNATESERAIKDEYISIKSKLTSLENQISSRSHDNEMLKMELENQKTETMLREQEKHKEIDVLQQKLKNECNHIEELKREVETLQESLSTEKAFYENEKKRCAILQEQIREKQENSSMAGALGNIPGNISPTPSIGRASLPDSLNSSIWPMDESFEVNSTARCTNMLEMQMLQTNLKQRDGEVQQLQWELNRREHERTLLNTEISNLLGRIEELEKKCSEHDSMQKELTDLRQQYDLLCQLYGEKVEETEELKLDLQDVKEMYKAQIDELLLQQRSATS